MQKNVASQKLTVFAFDSTTNLPKTGDAANITAYYDLDDAGVTILTDTSATEKDATNAKGYYIFDLAQAETNGNKILFSAKSATTNVVVIAVPAVAYTNPPNFTLTAIDASGRLDMGKINGVATTSVTTVNANVGTTQPTNFTGTAASALVKSDMVDVAGAAVSTTVAQLGVNAVNLGGTAQTGRDIGASVLLSSGTGTGQLDFTSGVVKANATQWLGGTIPAVNVTGVPLVDAKYLLGTVFSTPTVAGVPNVNVNTWNDLVTVALPLVPTTAGRTLDVSATGEAGVDWANIGSPTTIVGLTGTTIAATQQVDVNTIKTQTVTCAAGVTVNVNVGTTQPVNFTGTAGSALVKTDMVDIAGAAVSASTAQLGVNVVNVKGTASAGAAGYIGIDWSAINAPTTTVALSGTTVGTVTTTATATNVTTVNGLAAGVITATSIAADAITAAKIADGAIDTATFAGGTTIPRCTLTDTVTTYTGNTVQTGDAYARIGANGIGLTALGDTRIANLDATVSSRTKPADTQARVTLVDTVTNGVTVTTNNDKTGYSLTQGFPTNFAALGISAAGKINEVVLVDTLTTYTGNTPQSGNVYPLVDTEIAAIKAKTDNLPADPAGLAALASAHGAGAWGSALTARQVQALEFLRNAGYQEVITTTTGLYHIRNDANTADSWTKPLVFNATIPPVSATGETP